jgi:GTP pyrophosphokinase
MRTLEHMPLKNQVNKARETLFYAKLAESLGMWDVMRELEDLSLKYFNPKEFKKYSDMRDKDPRTQPEFVAGIRSRLEVILKDAGVEAKVEPRKNSLLRIKDKRGKYLPDKIDDLIRFGVIVKQGESEIETRNRVMMVLGALWQEFDAIEDKKRFDNFFFTPHDNGYSALHLTLKFDEGNIKVALTCEEKEIYNDRGILNLINEKNVDLQKYSLKLVITPTGEIKFFKPRATGVDYVYSISPSMGAMADYMLINGERRELTEIIPNGAEIEIKFAEHRRVPKKGLKDFALPPAKILIKEQEDDQIKFEKTMEGKIKVEKIMRERGLTDFEDLSEMEEFQPIYDDILRLLGCKENVMDLYHKIGSDVMDTSVLTEILDTEGITKEKIGTTIYIEGYDQPGLSTDITGKITDFGGNIGFQKGNVSKINKTFSMKLIVENLTSGKEEELTNNFQADPRITKVIVV